MSTLSILTNLLIETEEFNRLVWQLQNGKEAQLSPLPTSAKACLGAALSQYFRLPICIFTSDIRQANLLHEDIQAYSPDSYFLPTAQIESEQFIRQNELLHAQLMTLSKLHTSAKIVVSDWRGAIEKFPCPNKELAIRLEVGKEYERDILFGKFIEYGYKRTYTVIQPGQISLRGLIVDIFCIGREFPVRIEFNYNNIISIREFDIASQRSIKNLTEVFIYPINIDLYDNICLVEYLHCGVIILDSLQLLNEKIAHLKNTLGDRYSRYFISFEEFTNLISTRSRIFIQPIPQKTTIDLGFQEPILFDKKLTGNYMQNSQIYNCVLYLASTEIEAKYLQVLFKSEIIKGRLSYDNLREGSYILLCSQSSGFFLATVKLLLLPAHKLLNKFYRPKEKTQTFHNKTHICPDELSVGDYVVHEHYGIGRYCGFVVLDSYGEYALIEYAGKDRLYVPPHMMDRLYRYSGPPPQLHRLNDSAWHHTTTRIKQSICNFAKELLQLYAERAIVKTSPLKGDPQLEAEFQENFPYIETQGQLEATFQINEDLEKDVPMDRLLCGDVGYGKTEVGMRVAFRAVISGKQVAVVVPTTVLAQQHYETFSERFRIMPVNIALLTRLVEKKQQKSIITKLKRGEVDILIGTHRILCSDVEFKDLGLVIIDEEHRFGVYAKEKLKMLRKSVHVLSMSATPIPRTLHMSLSKLKDITCIHTPLPQRRPVTSYLLPYNETTIKEAILFELSRGGQVYFINNRIETIDKVAQRISEIVEGARVCICHGRLPAKTIKSIVNEFAAQRYDILVSTSIIASGIDIPTVNTLIVKDAHMFGLSELHQLRGRVGRSNLQAYAYFFYSKKALSDKVVERLRIIAQHSHLGSGFDIALWDLQLRGPGQLLGKEQHGNIHHIGVELYFKLLDDAINSLKKNGTYKETLPLKRINLPVKAYIPTTYIQDDTHRYRVYKSICSCKNEEELNHIKEEIEDRWGKLLPKSVINLLKLVQLRILADHLGIESIDYAAGKVRIKTYNSFNKCFGNLRGKFKLLLPNLIYFDYQNLTQTVNMVKELHLLCSDKGISMLSSR